MKRSEVSSYNYTLVLVLLIISGCFNKLEKPGEFHIVPELDQGRVYMFDIERLVWDSIGRDVIRTKGITPVELQIRKEENGIKTCSWKYGQLMEVENKMYSKIPGKELNDFSGLEILFTLDADGKILEMVNAEDVRFYMEDIFMDLFESNGIRIPPGSSILDTLMEKENMTLDQLVFRTLCPEIGLYFSLSGEKVKCDSVYEYPDYFQNPYGTGRLHALKEIKVNTVKNDVVDIAIFQTADHDSLYAFLRKLYSTPEFPEAYVSVENAHMNSVSSFKYNFDKKRMIEAVSATTYTLETKYHTETIRIISKD